MRLLKSLLHIAIYPYAKLIRHRHWLSHAPLIGTAGRLAYLAALGWLAWLALGRPDVALDGEALRTLAWAAAGLAASDALHWVMDVLRVKPIIGLAFTILLLVILIMLSRSI